MAVAGSFHGFPWNSPGNQEKFGNFYPNSEMLRIQRRRAPAKANLPPTLGRHCPGPSPHLLYGGIFDIDCYDLLEFNFPLILFAV